MVAKRKEIKEVPIFPMSCEKGHNFQPIKGEAFDGNIKGYYKKDDKDNRITDKVYAMLFCNQCGNVKEIVIVNYERN